MGQADDIREKIHRDYINPARARGESTVEVRAGDIQSSNLPNVCSAMSRPKIETLCSVKIVSIRDNQGRTGENAGPSTNYWVTYQLSTNTSIQPSNRGEVLGTENKVVNSDALPKKLSKQIRKLNKKIDRIAPSSKSTTLTNRLSKLRDEMERQSTLYEAGIINARSRDIILEVLDAELTRQISEDS